MEKQQQSNTKLSSYAESFNAFVGKDYVWPDWDEQTFGKSPLIVMPKFQSKEDVAEFNKVLSNVSKMAHVDSANELRNQLKALAGKEINIQNLTGNEDSQRGPIGTPVTGEMHGVGSGLEHDYSGNKPEISFNPQAWGIYPVQGSKNEYSIATPEQMLIHELGHYVEMQKIYDDLMLKNSKSNIPIAADINDKKAYHHAIDESHIVRDYENSAMASVDPSYKPRDADRYSDAKILLANENGYPDVDEQYRAVLIQSMRISGRAIPDELNAPIQQDKIKVFLEQPPEVAIKKYPELLGAISLKAALLNDASNMPEASKNLLIERFDAVVIANIEQGTLPEMPEFKQSVENTLESGVTI